MIHFCMHYTIPWHAINCASVSKHYVQYWDHINLLHELIWHFCSAYTTERHNANQCIYNLHASWPAFHLPQNILCSSTLILLFDLSNSYNGSQFVKEVTADFVVWEFNGRIDYGYNSTAAEVNTHLACMHHTIVLCIPYSCIAYDIQQAMLAGNELNRRQTSLFLSVCLCAGWLCLRAANLVSVTAEWDTSCTSMDTRGNSQKHQYSWVPTVTYSK